MLFVAQFRVEGDGEEWRDAELLSDMTYRIRNTGKGDIRVLAARGTDNDDSKSPMVTLRTRGGPRLLTPGAHMPFPITKGLCSAIYEKGFSVETPLGWYLSELPR